MGQEQREDEHSNEISKSVDIQKLLAEAVIFLSKSRLLGNDPNIAGIIRIELERARDTNNTKMLEGVIEALTNEKRFILDYARQFANKDAENISIYQLQGGMQQAFIEKMVYTPEIREKVDPDTALKELYKGYQLT